MANLDFIYNRHSVRRFKDQDVPMDDLKKIIEAATYAPSGKNMQNWHFVVVKNKEKMEGLAKVIEEKNGQLAEFIEDEVQREKFKKFLKFTTFFKNAPATILVYAGPYPVTGSDMIKRSGASMEDVHDFFRPSPGIQNIGAAMENLMLAAAELGYGTCWMTSPNYAFKEMTEYIGFNKEGYYLAAVIPLGIPDGEIKSPPRKPVEEVMTVIE